jgi:hypothetical protein
MNKTHSRALLLLAVMGPISMWSHDVYGQNTRFDVNDISFLWPVPDKENDVAALLSADTKPPDTNKAIWPKEIFDVVMKKVPQVSVQASSGAKQSINFGRFKDAVGEEANWKIVAFRVDPSAPGTSPMFTEAFGVIPQIRLIIQPVTMDEHGKPIVHDVTVHLVFNFVERFDPPPQPGFPPKGVPDKAKFRQIVEGLKTLKKASEDGNASTAGPLGVHPGLKAKIPGFADKVKEFVLTNLKDKDPFAAAFMGVDGSEPWIFFAMVRQQDDSFDAQRQLALGNDFAQMITFKGGNSVMPAPKTLNLDMTHGVSTASLFRSPGSDPVAKLDKPVFDNMERPLFKDIPDIIANPKRSNFFNTDCASCHSESTRRSELKIKTDGQFQYHRPDGVSGVDEAVLPKDRWNVRNFGWGPGGNGTMVPTVSMRTANESADCVEEINNSYLK